MADPQLYQSTVTQTSIPDYAKPDVETLLGKTFGTPGQNNGLIDTPYAAYPGQRTADFTDLQNQAFNAAQNLGPAGQLGAGSQLAGIAGANALNTNYQAGQFGPQQFQSQVGGYMNPYLQMALAPQMQELNRAYDISGNQAKGQATQVGAFGGTRQALMQAENERNRNMGLANILGQGYNTAFNNAQQQYQNSAQLGEQSRQFGAGLGLQGQQTALQAAGALGNLGATQFGQQAQALGLQNQLGTQQQAQQQNILNQQYQDFLNQQNYPYKQLSFASDMLRGLPLSQGASQIYQAPPTNIQNVTSLGMGAAGVGQLLKGLGSMKKGGSVKEERGHGLGGIALRKLALRT
jgi:hypothetical protein